MEERHCMKLNKWKIRTTYEATGEDEILLPDGVEISAVFVKYGKITIETKCGSHINMSTNQFGDIFDLKRPTSVSFFKDNE
jgi:hypothetical protein